MTGDDAPEPRVELPALAGPLDTLWDLVLDLAEQLPPTGWALVGGQMVMLHGLLAGRMATRASQDVDVLADLLTDEAGLGRCVRAVRELDLEPQPDAAGKVYRFVRARDQARADVLAPDHTPPRRRLRTVGGDTIRIEGGTQALRRMGLPAEQYIYGCSGIASWSRVSGRSAARTDPGATRSSVRPLRGRHAARGSTGHRIPGARANRRSAVTSGAPSSSARATYTAS